ncbi:ABC transporter permease [Chryseolinea lacunae]|uniref:ABC transporter permease n=1 Tax=Chryseolinea lacunae TaxID=2801331 RepID=A0ABS1KMQ2_9BACT|nr:ABC transporter permease subunit [Chryseolinea lacunae]MBL0740726.1 ABC transporter permease [Chryseolinea lacunae]
MSNFVVSFKRNITENTDEPRSNPFWVMVRREIASHIRSWRFVLLLGLVALTFFGSIYVSFGNIGDAVNDVKDPDHLFVYLKLLTTTDGNLPAFHVLLSFLGPLLGISLGFDAINAEKQNGTLIRILAQPVYRDNLLLSKFTGSLVLVGALFLVLTLIMVGTGLFVTGVLIEAEEALRILSFAIVCVMYIGFWLSLSILLSIAFAQAATSALAAIGIWLFLTVFYQIGISMVVKALVPASPVLSETDILSYNELLFRLFRLAPSQLFADATTTLLMPSVRSLGLITMEQMAGAIPSPLSYKESVMIVWPQISGLIAATVACFALSYYLFMRREVRS